MRKNFPMKRRVLTLLLLFSLIITLGIRGKNNRSKFEYRIFEDGNEVIVMFHERYERFESVANILYGKYDVFHSLMNENGSYRIQEKNIDCLSPYMDKIDVEEIKSFFRDVEVSQIYHGSGFIEYEFAVKEGRNPFVIYYIGGNSNDIRDTLYYLGQLFDVDILDTKTENWYCSFTNAKELFYGNN